MRALSVAIGCGVWLLAAQGAAVAAPPGIGTAPAAAVAASPLELVKGGRGRGRGQVRGFAVPNLFGYLPRLRPYGGQRASRTPAAAPPVAQSAPMASPTPPASLPPLAQAAPVAPPRSSLGGSTWVER